MKVTDDYFEEFKLSCVAYQEILKLDQWDLQVEWENIKHQADALCIWDGMVARVRLTTGEVHYEPKRLAFHEMMEVYLWPVRELLEKIHKAKQADRIIHVLINNVENKLFGPAPKKEKAEDLTKRG